MGRADAIRSQNGPPSLRGLEPPPHGLLDAPLDYFLAEHARNRSLAVSLRRIAAQRSATREEADAIRAFLATDLELHHRDEDDDLFPAVRRRMQSEDGLEPILDRLSADHRRSAAVKRTIAAALGRHLPRDTVPISARCARVMMAYAACGLRHLSIESGIVLVIARKRLSPRDLKDMSRTMKARREGIARGDIA